MAANTPLQLSKKSQSALKEFYSQAFRSLQTTWNIRTRMRDIDLSYLRENDWTTENARARVLNKLGDPTRLQNLQIPIVMPQVVSAVAYQVAVFCSQYPLLEVVSSAKFENEALQLQSVFEENSIRAGWIRQLILFLYDCVKYNHSALEVDWSKIYTAAIETDVGFKGGKEGVPKQLVWAGNVLNRWDPYNTFFDHRVEAPQVSEDGEFAGTVKRVSRMFLKKFLNRLDNGQIVNYNAAFESQGGSNGGDECEPYYVPELNPEALVDSTTNGEVTDWSSWVAEIDRSRNGSMVPIQYKNEYDLYTLYARLIPSDFDIRIPSSNTPQVFKLYIVNGQVAVYCERQTNAHEKIPVLFGQAAEDGLRYQTKSLASNAKPFQEIATGLASSVMSSRRRAISDRLLYDPSRVSEAHINSPNPVARIPVKPAAYGKPLSEAVYAFPFNDNQANITLGEMQTVIQMANVLNNQNQARQGQFVKGNKTDSQWDAVMAGATAKDQMTALLLEAQVFTPMKEILKINTLQYQGEAAVFSPTRKEVVEIDPVALRKAVMTFKVTDGLVPVDKVINSEVLQAAFQVIGSSEHLSMQYRLGELFSYLMKTQSADISEFEKSPEQVAYEQALNTWSAVAQTAAEKGIDFAKFQPQPKPADYGYNPNADTTSQPVQQVPA
jgi:hypothetical protein